MINAETLEQIATLIEQRGLSETLVDELRDSYPGKHFTWCMDDDVHSGKPVLQRPGFCIYLVDSSEHCSHITSSVESASGFVLAEIVE